MLRVGVMGLGPVGRAIARAAAQHGELELRAAIDRDPALAGRRLEALVPQAKGSAIVRPDLQDALSELRGGLLLHATGSRLPEIAPQIRAAVAARVAVVSCCPDLVYPWHAHPAIARAIDAAAADAGVAVLATGVNPGFVLDRLVVAAAAASGNVRSVRALRSVDISRRREALRCKAGVGLSPNAFRERAAAGAVGHVGLQQSAALVAAGLGLRWDALDDSIEPVFVDPPHEGPVAIAAGAAAGYRQRVVASDAGRARVRLELTYAVGAADRDALSLDADPPVELAIEGGLSGDLATAWSVVNAAPALARATPGLRSVLDLPAAGRRP